MRKWILILVLAMVVCLVVGMVGYADDYDRVNDPLPQIGKPIALVTDVVWW